MAKIIYQDCFYTIILNMEWEETIANFSGGHYKGHIKTGNIMGSISCFYDKYIPIGGKDENKYRIFIGRI